MKKKSCGNYSGQAPKERGGKGGFLPLIYITASYNVHRGFSLYGPDFGDYSVYFHALHFTVNVAETINNI